MLEKQTFIMGTNYGGLEHLDHLPASDCTPSSMLLLEAFGCWHQTLAIKQCFLNLSIYLVIIFCRIKAIIAKVIKNYEDCIYKLQTARLI